MDDSHLIQSTGVSVPGKRPRTLPPGGSFLEMNGLCAHTSRMSEKARGNQEAPGERPAEDPKGSAAEDSEGSAAEPTTSRGESGAEGQEPLGPARETVPGGEEGDQGHRPTPARVVMEGAVDEERGGGPQRRTLRDPADGREWVLEVVGRSTSGVLPLRSIRLMEVRFATADNPELPLRTVLCQEADLDDLSDDEVLGLFHMSRACGRSDERNEGPRPGEGRGGGRRGR
jgi:hypothetical protein